MPKFCSRQNKATSGAVTKQTWMLGIRGHMIPKINLVVVVDPAHQADGEAVPAQVVEVHANLPRCFVDVHTVEASIFTDDEGNMSHGEVSVLHPRGLAPFMVFDAFAWRPQPVHASESWEVGFEVRGRRRTALVMAAKSASAAIHRVEEEFASACVTEVCPANLGHEENDLASYMTDFDAVLPVGGPAVRRKKGQGAAAVSSPEGS
jgi:hypothetical protein